MTLAKAFILIIVLTLSYLRASAQVLAQGPDATRDNLRQRVQQLESQMEAIRDELMKLKSALGEESSASVSTAEKKPTTEASGALSSTPQRNEPVAEKHLTGIGLGPRVSCEIWLLVAENSAENS